MKGIIGIGNPLKSDDGIGILLMREIDEKDLPFEVRKFDVGIASIDLLHILKELDRAIIIDAVHFGESPGEYRFFSLSDVKSLQESTGPHTTNILNVLNLSKEMGELPEDVIIMGIEPKDTSFGEDLSEDLEKNFSELKDALYDKIRVFFDF